jgi:succinate dehydrogenase / fumarate reductase membrane anchor subunit
MNNQYDSGHGKGSHHWRWQRITAIGLIPFTLWFLFSIVQHIGDDHAAVSNWVAQPYVAVLLVLYLILMFFHGQLGIQEIIEDYVHHAKLKKFCSMITKLGLLAAAIAAVISVIRIAT